MKLTSTIITIGSFTASFPRTFETTGRFSARSDGKFFLHGNSFGGTEICQEISPEYYAEMIGRVNACAGEINQVNGGILILRVATSCTE